MAVQSPCVEVCKIDGKTGYCVGCLRIRDEIRGWKNMTDHRRHQVINERFRRHAKLPRESAESPARAKNARDGSR
jgi:uncharacterized protein